MDLFPHEPARLRRLQKTLNTFCLVYGISPEQVEKLVYALADERGTLVVHWYHPPTQEQQLAWHRAWTQARESTVRHEVVQ